MVQLEQVVVALGFEMTQMERIETASLVEVYQLLTMDDASVPCFPQQVLSATYSVVVTLKPKANLKHSFLLLKFF